MYYTIMTVVSGTSISSDVIERVSISSDVIERVSISSDVIERVSISACISVNIFTCFETIKKYM